MNEVVLRREGKQNGKQLFEKTDDRRVYGVNTNYITHITQQYSGGKPLEGISVLHWESGDGKDWRACVTGTVEEVSTKISNGAVEI